MARENFIAIVVEIIAKVQHQQLESRISFTTSSDLVTFAGFCLGNRKIGKWHPWRSEPEEIALRDPSSVSSLRKITPRRRLQWIVSRTKNPVARTQL